MVPKKVKRRHLLDVSLFIILPTIFILAGSLIFVLISPKVFIQQPVETNTVKKLVGLKPSDITKDVLYYADKEINLQGIVSQSPKKCIERICPANDQCCGCDEIRDIVLKDYDSLLDSSELKLYDNGKKSYCQKNQSSCDYDCGDWHFGGAYEITGTLVVIRSYGITTTRGYLEYYIEVKDKKYIPTPTQPTLQNKFLDKIMQKYISPLFSKRQV